MLYFAYGSNMSSQRLVGRVGQVEVIGVGQLQDWRHGFTKRGDDGTGKGNVHPHPGDEVYGVVYRIDVQRGPELDQIEGGYRRTEVAVQVARDWLDVFTYVALEPRDGLFPSQEYLAHYRQGIHEHGIANSYWWQILRDAGN